MLILILKGLLFLRAPLEITSRHGKFEEQCKKAKYLDFVCDLIFSTLDVPDLCVMSLRIGLH